MIDPRGATVISGSYRLSLQLSTGTVPCSTSISRPIEPDRGLEDEEADYVGVVVPLKPRPRG